MITKESLSRDLFRLVVWYPVRWLAQILPIRLSLSLFRFMGDLHRMTARNAPKRIERQMNDYFGDSADRTDAAREHFRNHYVDRLHIFLYPKLLRLRENERCRAHSSQSEEKPAEWLEIEDPDLIDEILRDGKGLIIVHAHHGPIQLPLFVLGLLGYSALQIGMPTDEGLSRIGRKVAYDLRRRYEALIPGRILSADEFLRPVFRHLAEGGILMTTGDGTGHGRFIGRFQECSVGGHRAFLPVGWAKIAARSKAPVLFARLERKGARYLWRLERFKTTGDSLNDLDDPDTVVSGHVAAFARFFEESLRRDPGLWHFWDHWREFFAGPKK